MTETTTKAREIETVNAAIRAILQSNPMQASIPLWQHLVAATAETVVNKEWESAKATFDAALEPLWKSDRRLADSLDSALAEVICHIQDCSVLIGAALAFTWPTNPVDLSTWVERAKKFATDK